MTAVSKQQCQASSLRLEVWLELTNCLLHH